MLWRRAKPRYAGLLTAGFALAIWRDVLHGPPAMYLVALAVAAVAVAAPMWHRRTYGHARRVVALTAGIASYGASASGSGVAVAEGPAARRQSWVREVLDRRAHRRYVVEPVVS